MNSVTRAAAGPQRHSSARRTPTRRGIAGAIVSMKPANEDRRSRRRISCVCVSIVM
jgi:hypothetical protein